MAHFGARNADDNGIVGTDDDPGVDFRRAVRGAHDGGTERNIEAQRKAVEQMLQVLDIVARHDYCASRAQESERPNPYFRTMRENKNRRLRREVSDAAQGYLDVPVEESLEPAEHALG